MRRSQARLVAMMAVAMHLASFPVAAQDVLQVLPPVLILDQERLFESSAIAVRISEEAERRTAALDRENRRIDAELVKEELGLTERRASLDPNEFRRLADEFHEKVQAIRAEQDAKTVELQRFRNEDRQEFLVRIRPILTEIARERGAIVVLDRRSVLLSAESIDITDEAIWRINEAFKQPQERESAIDDAPVPAGNLPADDE